MTDLDNHDSSSDDTVEGPIVTNSTEPTCEEPANLASMRLKAEALGWTTATLYGSGRVSVSVKLDGRMVRSLVTQHSVSLRLQRPGYRAWAVWVDGGFDGGAFWDETTHAEPVGFRELARRLDVGSAP